VVLILDFAATEAVAMELLAVATDPLRCCK
jgi:hypothetical protein